MKINITDIQTAFTLPPVDAIAYLESKGYTIASNWKDSLTVAHNRAFTAAGILRLDILTSLKDSLVKALGQGTPLNEWQKTISVELASLGVSTSVTEIDKETGKEVTTAIPPHRLENIFRTNTLSALNAGKVIRMDSVGDARPYRRIHFINDGRQSEICQKLSKLLEGKVIHYKDPFLKKCTPPNHFQCRDTITSHSLSEVERNGWQIYKGDGSEWQAGEGFDGSPVDGYEPDLSKYPKDLIKEFKSFLTKRRKELDKRLEAA